MYKNDNRTVVTLGAGGGGRIALFKGVEVIATDGVTEESSL